MALTQHGNILIKRSNLDGDGQTDTYTHRENVERIIGGLYKLRNPSICQNPWENHTTSPEHILTFALNFVNFSCQP